MDRLSFLNKFIYMYVCIYELCICVYMCICLANAKKFLKRYKRVKLCSSPYPAVDLAG